MDIYMAVVGPSRNPKGKGIERWVLGSSHPSQGNTEKPRAQELPRQLRGCSPRYQQA